MQVSDIMLYLSFCVSLLSLSMLFSKLIHISTCGRVSFLRLSHTPLYVGTTFCLSTHPLTGTGVVSMSGLL